MFKPYIEILAYKSSTVLFRSRKSIGEINYAQELDKYPALSIILDIDTLPYLYNRCEVIVHLSEEVIFHGLVKEIIANKEDEYVEVELNHILSEWEHDNLPINFNVKNTDIKFIYDNYGFKPDEWTINYLQGSATTKIEYNYSQQNQLQGLEDTLSQTELLHYRPKMLAGRVLDIGVFGEYTGLIFSRKNTAGRNIKIISEVEMNIEWDKVINTAIVQSEKNGSTFGSVTMSLIKNTPGLEDPQFPINETGRLVNNERTYDNNAELEYVPNNNTEFAIEDIVGVAQERGIVYRNALNFGDLYPIPDTDEPITDADRLEIAKRVYNRVKRMLILSRRKTSYTFDVGELPSSVEVGMQVRFIYDNIVYNDYKCEGENQEIISMDKNMFIREIETTISTDGKIINKVVLDEWIRPRVDWKVSF